MADSQVRFLGQFVDRRSHDPRLANSRLAGQQHKLPVARLRLLPFFENQPQLVVAADHRGN